MHEPAGTGTVRKVPEIFCKSRKKKSIQEAYEKIN